jgi:hypothetical protein
MPLRILALAAILSSTAALAQDTKAAAAKAKAEATAKDKVDVATESIAKLREEKPKTRGWDMGLKLGGTGAMQQNDKFVGQTDGVTLQVGVLLSGNADLVTGDHEWRNSLALEHAQLKTPVLERFVKSADRLELKSLYLYRIPKADWLGPFARLRAFTQLFPGEIVSTDRVVYERAPRDTTTVAPQEPFRLTNIFEPLVLEESAGAFVEPLTGEKLTVGARLGLGAQQVIGQQGLVLADDAATPNVEVAELRTVVSAGVEGELNAKGTVVKELLSWSALVGAYYPALINDNRGLEGGELLHFNVGAGVSLKLSKWLSVDYNLRLLKQPFVLDDLQVQNAVLISTGFDLLRSTVKER